MKNINYIFFFYLLMMIIPAKMNAQNKDFYTMVEYAIKAPSGHNSQPWKFKINESSIEIQPDFSKTLNVVDSDNRELFISLGCAAENLCITASTLNYETDISISEVGVITIHLYESGNIESDTLFSVIEKRQTNRNVYEKRKIESNIPELYFPSIPENEQIHFHHWENGSESFEILKKLILEGNIIQMDDEMFRKELKSWMRYNRRESDNKKDGLSYYVFGAPNLPLFISKPAIRSHLNSKKQNKGDLKKMESSSHFVLISSANNNIENWINVGRYMQRFLLIITANGIAHSYMNQPCEIHELSEQLKKKLTINNEYPQIILRIGYAKEAPYSRRKSMDEVILK